MDEESPERINLLPGLRTGETEGGEGALHGSSSANDDACSSFSALREFPHEEAPRLREERGVERMGDVGGHAGGIRDDLVSPPHGKLLLESSEIHIFQLTESFLPQPLPEVRESGRMRCVMAE